MTSEATSTRAASLARSKNVLPEFPPKTALVLATGAALVLMLVTALIIQVPRVSEVTIVGVRDDALRVAGQNIPHVTEGTLLVLLVGAEEVAGVAGQLEDIPDTSARAFIFTPFQALAVSPDQYSEAQANFGDVSVAEALIGAW